MKILMVHNYYQQAGGEDNSFASEVDLLRNNGHEVFTYTRHNDELTGSSPFRIAQKTIWNQDVYKEIRSLIRKVNPDVVHFQNTFIVISPAAYYAVKAEGVPIVQALRNFRLICPGALFFRADTVCEDCLEKFIPWPGVLHSCYRESRAATSVVAAMLICHRMLKTFSRKIDRFIALTEFSRTRFIRAGLPVEKIEVKPNFVGRDLISKRCLASPDINTDRGHTHQGYALFVGRLSIEKGIKTLLQAWDMVGFEFELIIVGDGPLADVVQAAASARENISWVGQKSTGEVYDLMACAMFLVFPSQWYEGMPRTVIETYAQGTPVLASNLGAMAEMIAHNHNGLHFEGGNAADLAEKINWAFAHPEEMAQMGENAMADYEENYSPEKNYEMLMNIYEKAIENNLAQQARKGSF